MSLITRCPACGTMFKVVPDQLRISEGWVRCGHCAEVFDATAHMQAHEAPITVQPLPTEPAPLEAALDSQAHAPAYTPADSRPYAPVDSRVDSRYDSEAFPSSLTTEFDGIPSGVPDSVELREAADALFEGPLDQPFVLQRQEAPAAVEMPVLPPVEGEPDPELHDLSFVKQARRKAFWSRGPVRVVLLLLFVGLALLLAGQVGINERDRIAAMQPQLRPWLAMLCELRCDVRAPRQIDAISIDSSAFNKLRADTYRLNVTLKNQAAFEVAMPALELTLTDAQDQPVVRRVVTASELAQQRVAIPASGDWSGAVAIAVGANGPAAKVAGYRVLAFYP